MHVLGLQKQLRHLNILKTKCAKHQYWLHRTSQKPLSRNGIGAVLVQDERPIAFESRPIKGKYLHKALYGKEMLAILHALKKWRPYLMGRKFKVKKDHDSIKKNLEQILSS